MHCHRVCTMYLCLAVTRHCCELSKISENFQLSELFVIFPAEYFAVAILSIPVLGFLPASYHSLQLPAPLPLFFNTHVQIHTPTHPYTHTPPIFLLIVSHMVFFVPLLFRVEVPPTLEVYCWCFLPTAVSLLGRIITIHSKSFG